jgi:dienelactone hydrolase
MKIVFVFFFLILLSCSQQDNKSMVKKEIKYQLDTLQMHGYLVYDESIKEKRPAILVVHEWWGQNKYPRKRAEMIAKLGYVAFAVDMYGNGKVAEHPKDAGVFSSSIMRDFETNKERFLKAMEVVKGFEFVDSSKIGAIGYCFGGGVVLNMARLNVGLSGVASFHGSLGKAISYTGPTLTKILVCNGADDRMVGSDAILRFKEEMDSLKADYQFVNYPNSLHGFTNPESTINGEKFGIGLAYNKEADLQSWEKMQTFFQAIFK